MCALTPLPAPVFCHQLSVISSLGKVENDGPGNRRWRPRRPSKRPAAVRGRALDDECCCGSVENIDGHIKTGAYALFPSIRRYIIYSFFLFSVSFIICTTLLRGGAAYISISKHFDDLFLKFQTTSETNMPRRY